MKNIIIKTKPILFSTEMVQANLKGIKSQTRRIVDEMHYMFLEYAFHHKKNITDWIIRTAKYQPGDILWVRETFWFDPFQQVYHYKADEDSCMKLFTGWKPSIHMPKKIARIFLKVTSVRCERLKDISDEDAIAEGMDPDQVPTYRFAALWKRLNGEDSWNRNPFVFIYEYEIIEKPKNFLKTNTFLK